MDMVKIRAILSSSLIVVFLFVAITGILLFIAPHGPHSHAEQWSFLGLSKETISKIHTITGFLFVVLVIVHFLINRTMYSTELKALTKH